MQGGGVIKLEDECFAIQLTASAKKEIVINLLWIPYPSPWKLPLASPQPSISSMISTPPPFTLFWHMKMQEEERGKNQQIKCKPEFFFIIKKKQLHIVQLSQSATM